MRAKTFFYVCAGLFLLALSYYLGASSASRRRIVTRELVVTDQLVVTDDAGRQRVTITVDTGGPHLSLANEAGYPTVMLTGASFTDKSDRAKFGHGPFGGYLAFYDPVYRGRAVQVGFRMEEGPDRWPAAADEPGIAVYGKDGHKAWSAPAKE